MVVKMNWEIKADKKELTAELNGGINCIIPFSPQNLHFLQELKVEINQTLSFWKGSLKGGYILDEAIARYEAELGPQTDFDKVVEAIKNLNLKGVTLSDNRGSLIVRFDDYKEETPEEINARAFDLVEVKKPGAKKAGQTGGLTEKETELMQLIPLDNFYESGYESILWTRIFVDDAGLDEKKTRGVLSSLVKKGLIRIDTDETEENEWSRSTLALNQKGIEWLNEYGKVDLDEDGYKIR